MHQTFYSNLFWRGVPKNLKNHALHHNYKCQFIFVKEDSTFGQKTQIIYLTRVNKGRSQLVATHFKLKPIFYTLFMHKYEA